MGCSSQFSVDNGRYIFLKNPPSALDLLDRIKSIFKSFPRLYSFIVRTFSPVYSPDFTSRFISDYIQDKSLVSINLGSGAVSLSDNMIDIDCVPYKNVSIVCNITSLPVADSSVDRILNSAVLEHVPSPEAAVNEMLRIMKPGAVICCYMPFIVGYHASPHDYSRLTIEGMRHLFKDFDIVSLDVCGGPTSGLLWILQEWLALILSFGSKNLHLVLYILISMLTWPVKYIDVILRKHPASRNIASGFLITARKPSQ